MPLSSSTLPIIAFLFHSFSHSFPLHCLFHPSPPIHCLSPFLLNRTELRRHFLFISPHKCLPGSHKASGQRFSLFEGLLLAARCFHSALRLVFWEENSVLSWKVLLIAIKYFIIYEKNVRSCFSFLLSEQRAWVASKETYMFQWFYCRLIFANKRPPSYWRVHHTLSFSLI